MFFNFFCLFAIIIDKYENNGTMVMLGTEISWEFSMELDANEVQPNFWHNFSILAIPRKFFISGPFVPCIPVSSTYACLGGLPGDRFLSCRYHWVVCNPPLRTCFAQEILRSLWRVPVFIWSRRDNSEPSTFIAFTVTTKSCGGGSKLNGSILWQIN